MAKKANALVTSVIFKIRDRLFIAEFSSSYSPPVSVLLDFLPVLIQNLIMHEIFIFQKDHSSRELYNIPVLLKNWDNARKGIPDIVRRRLIFFYLQNDLS